jgi:hypothetical protein
MRYQNGIVAVATVLLGALMLTGTLFTGHFPQAARAEAVGFDALAHDLFAAAPASEQGNDKKGGL